MGVPKKNDLLLLCRKNSFGGFLSNDISPHLWFKYAAMHNMNGIKK